MMPEPRDNVAKNMYGREDAIRTLRCIQTIGCGRNITTKEYQAWDINTRSEYEMSGMCLQCQNLFFIDDECICVEIDVMGPGYPLLYIHNDFCSEHGDPDFLKLVLNDDYDPDMREDEKPNDIYEIKWTRHYA